MGVRTGPSAAVHLFQIMFQQEPMAACGTIAPVIATTRRTQPCRPASRMEASGGSTLRAGAVIASSGVNRGDDDDGIVGFELRLESRHRGPRRAAVALR
jgi:hypothetical protein